MKAAERIACYAARLPLVEIDATARFPPTPDLARQWADRTPDGFTIDVQAWSLLTGGAALPDSLWEDLREEVRPDMRDRRRLYAGHLSDDALRESWSRFAHAIEPLRSAGRLGAVVLRYPHWLKPGDTGRTLMAEARDRLPDLRLAVELRNWEWLTEDCEETLSFLEDHDLGFVCVDAFGAPPVVATTSDLAVVRFHGRNPGDWEDPDMWLPERFAYRYSEAELAGWAPRLADLAAATDEVHAIFANTWRDDAVVNAEQMTRLSTR